MCKFLFYFFMTIGFISITGYNLGYFVFNPRVDSADWIDITKAVFSIMACGYFIRRLSKHIQSLQN